MEITGEMILQALSKDAKFRSYTPEMQAVMKPFMHEMASVLAGYTDTKVSVLTLTKARMAFLLYLAESNYTRAVINAMPKDKLPDVPLEELINAAEEGVVQNVLAMGKVVQNSEAHLKSLSLDEDTYMTSSKHGGLTPQMLWLYLEGALTIGTLMVSQPGALLINSNTKI